MQKETHTHLEFLATEGDKGGAGNRPEEEPNIFAPNSVFLLHFFFLPLSKGNKRESFKFSEKKNDRNHSISTDMYEWCPRLGRYPTVD
jgi:hypothetical protein